MCQISSLMAAAEGPVAEFSSFANFEEKKGKSNLLMPFPKTGNQMGSFGQIRKNSFFCFCRPILDIFGFTLLKKCTKLNWNFQMGGGGGGLRKNPFHGGGMDIFWNHTILNSCRKYQCLGMMSLYMFWCGISISL